MTGITTNEKAALAELFRLCQARPNGDCQVRRFVKEDTIRAQ